jgi:signal transduction histidine kinase
MKSANTSTRASFFLETLLRQIHFDKGRYVLQRTKFSFASRVVAAQLERYRLPFYERNIAVEERSFEGVENVIIDGDVGLLSQVMANFFSNAVKYTRATPGVPGLKLRCITTLEKDYFDRGLDGIKVAVLTTGAEISENESPHLFSENFRVSNTGGEQGTGHGLYFPGLLWASTAASAGMNATSKVTSFLWFCPSTAKETSLFQCDTSSKFFNC